MSLEIRYNNHSPTEQVEISSKEEFRSYMEKRFPEYFAVMDPKTGDKGGQISEVDAPLGSKPIATFVCKGFKDLPNK